MTTIHCTHCSACIAGGWEVMFEGKPYHTACYDKLRKPSAKDLAWRESDEEKAVKAKTGLGVIEPISHREILTMLAATSTDEEIVRMISRPRVLPDGTVWIPNVRQPLEPKSEIEVFNSIAENPSDGYPPNRRAIMEKVDRDREANAIIEAASCRDETTDRIVNPKWKTALDTTVRMLSHPAPSVDPEPQTKATGGIVEYGFTGYGSFRIAVPKTFEGPYKGAFDPPPTATPETKAMQRTNQEVSNLFAHHPPKDQKTVDRHVDLRNKFAALAVELNETLTDGRLKSLALTNLEQTAMWAQKSVALDGTGA